MILTGTASGHNDLLAQLHDFLVNDVGWTEMAWTPGGSPGSDSDLVSAVLRAPGATAGNEYFLYLDSRFDVGNGYYGWRMRAAIDYDSTLDIAQQTMISPEIYLNLWNSTISFWFYATSRRVIVVAKVNTSYVSMYGGLFLPFALPSQYAKPFYLAANYPSLNKYDVANTRNRFLADPGRGCAFYLNREITDWIEVANHESASSDTNFTTDAEAIMWPHRSLYSSAENGFPVWNTKGMSRMRPLANGQVPMFITHILSNLEHKAVGALDGVYSIPGFGKTSEQLLSFGSPARDFRAFQNIFRTTNRDFMSIEEI